MDGDLSPQGRGLELGSQLDELQALLGGLGLLYNAKRDALRNPINSNNAGERDTPPQNCEHHPCVTTKRLSEEFRIQKSELEPYRLETSLVLF